jgi:hypothetical protein
LEASIGTGYKTQTKQTTMPLSKDSCGDYQKSPDFRIRLW